MNRKLLVNTLVPIAVWIILLAMPIPQGLAPNAWYYFALFAAVIVGLVLEPVPGSIIGLLGLSVAAVLHLIGDKPADSVKCRQQHCVGVDEALSPLCD